MGIRSWLLYNAFTFISVATNSQSQNYSFHPKVYAVVVGINNYSDSNIPYLNFPEKDAKAVYDFLRSPDFASVPEENIALLVGDNATRINILKEVRNKFKRSTKDDMIIFYFSGHGIPGFDGKGYFLTKDSEYEEEATAISMPELKDKIERFSAKIKLSFVDACHAGLFSSSNKGLKTEENTLIAKAFLDTIAKSTTGTIRFLASSEREESREDIKFGHGIFTYFLLKGLKGEADLSQSNIMKTYNDGSVNISELNTYLTDNISKYTGYNQRPSLQGNYDDQFPLSIFDKKSNRISLPKRDSVFVNPSIIFDGTDLKDGYVIRKVLDADNLWNIVQMNSNKIINKIPLDCNNCYFDPLKNLVVCEIIDGNKPKVIKYYSLDGKLVIF